MAYTQLKAKIWSAASAYAPLTALLGASPFRLYDVQLPQSATFPAITMFQVSNPRVYVATGRMATSFVRVQFTVYGTGNDSTNADAVAEALASFLDNFNAAGLPNSPANANDIVGDRDMGIAQTQPLTYMRVIDAMIFNSEAV